MLERKDVVTFKGNPITLLGEEVKVNDVAKDFTVLSKELEEVKLSDFKGKVVVISVFPSVDTGICALQTARFNQEVKKFPEDVQVVTVSVDLPFALDRFCATKGIDNSITTSDHRELDFGLKYGFVIKELRLLTRGIVIVDREGVVKYVEYVPEVAQHPDYSKALDLLEKLV